MTASNEYMNDAISGLDNPIVFMRSTFCIYVEHFYDTTLLRILVKENT